MIIIIMYKITKGKNVPFLSLVILCYFLYTYHYSILIFAQISYVELMN